MQHEIRRLLDRSPRAEFLVLLSIGAALHLLPALLFDAFHQAKWTPAVGYEASFLLILTVIGVLLKPARNWLTWLVLAGFLLLRLYDLRLDPAPSPLAKD